MSAAAPERADVAVIILTLDEHDNLPHALRSVAGWAREVMVLDSYSSDDTVEIARGFGCFVAQRRFTNYSEQRNFALEQLPVTASWILFLDADEWLTEDLKREIAAMCARDPAENGWYIKRRVMWMGRWIRRGYYPTWILRLFRRGHGRCEARAVNEHLIVDGKTGELSHDFVHEDHRGIRDWIAKHNRYAHLEAIELMKRLRRERQEEISDRFWGSQGERKRWLRNRVWNRLPPLLRPFMYFGYRFFLTGAFIEGRAAFIYHFMQALWYPLLIDAMYLEMKLRGD